MKKALLSALGGLVAVSQFGCDLGEILGSNWNVIALDAISALEVLKSIS